MSQVPSMWDMTTLGTAGKWLSGGTPRTTDSSYWGGEIPWVSSKSLTKFRMRDSERRVTELGAANGTRIVEAGAILMVVRGMSLKSEFRMGVAQRRMAFGQDCKALIARADIDPTFLAYAIQAKTPEILDLVDEAGHGTGRLNTDQLHGVEIALPARAEQEAIVATLACLDDKIELTKRLTVLIPALMAAHIDAALAHGSDEVPVSELARFVNGGAYTKGATGHGRMVLRIAELNSGPGPSTVYNELNVDADRLARPGDLLMSWSGSLDVYRWSRDEAIVNQHIFKVIPEQYPPWLVHDRLAHVMPKFQRIAADKATTMGHIQRGHLKSTLVAVPSDRAIERLDDALDPLWARLLGADRELLHLATLRAALLPEITTGSLRVPMKNNSSEPRG
jgi:type I restriction enzyme S subunit